MIIRCWGARGSIPVSGKEYDTVGGDTTCLELRTKQNTVIIVDAGTGIRRLGNRLIQEEARHYHLLLTHSHWDHLLGFPFFKPIYAQGVRIDVFGCRFAQKSIEGILSQMMHPPFFPVKLEDVKAELLFHGACRKPFSIDSMLVTPIRISHPNQGLGYKFEEDGKTFVFLTDNELTFRHPGGLAYQEYLEFSRDADVLVHDAEFTEEEYRSTKTWGHSTYRDALRLAMEAGAGRFGLFHHNQDRTDAAVDEIVKDCRRIVKSRGSRMDVFAMAVGMEIRL